MFFSNKQILKTRNSGFTLIELLLVIAIIAVLSSLALAVVGGAQTEARRSATVARLGQIRALMLGRIEQFEFRKIPVRLNDYNITDRQTARQVSNRIIADMINVEMPRFYVPPSPPIPPSLTGKLFPSPNLRGWLTGVLSTSDANNLIADLEVRRSILTDELQTLPSNLDSSEYLSAIMKQTDVDGTTGVDALGNNAFADLHGDSVLSVVDAWGDEIEFSFFVMNQETNDLYRDPDDVVNVPQRPFELYDLIELDMLSDGTEVKFSSHDIVITFTTQNPL